MTDGIAIARQHHVEADIRVTEILQNLLQIPMNVKKLPHLVQKTAIVMRLMKNVTTELVKNRVILIHAQTANIRIAVILMTDMSANVPHLHAEADINAKVLLPEFRTVKTLPIQVCVKSCKQKAVQRTMIVLRKRSVQTDIAFTAVLAPPTAIVQAGNIAVQTVIVPLTIKCLNYSNSPPKHGGLSFCTLSPRLNTNFRNVYGDA